jgi:hypothetical protein
VRHPTTLAEFRAGLTSGIDRVISGIEFPDGTGMALMLEHCADHVLPPIAMRWFGSDEDVSFNPEAAFAERITKPIGFRRLKANDEQLV